MRILIIAAALLVSGCAAESYQGINRSTNTVNASWYSSGNRTASGQRFNPHSFSVAHRTLPFGTIVHLTNPSNGSRISAVVNDRGPFVKNRTLDVSRSAAQALGFISRGTARLIMEVDRSK